MQIEVTLHTGPLPTASHWCVEGAGAVIRFEGVIRPTEAERPLAALRYETYEPMTSRELHRLSHEVGRTHDLCGVRVMHSCGEVPVGAVSFRLDVASRHRAEGLAAMEAFIDRLKQEVPLWKVPVWAEVQVSR